MTDKIIHSFQTRRQLNQAIDELAETSSEAELTRAARAIVQTYPHDLVLNALLKHLDAPGGQLRGGLGHIAALLPQEDVAPALQAAAANRQNSPQVRVTAALLFERFLGQELPAGLISDLDDSNEMPFQSLSEAVDAARFNRYVLLEYVTQMRETEADVAYMVMDLMERLPPADRIELLRLIAQDDRPPVAEDARQRLEQLGVSEAGEAAARALHILRHSLPPEQTELAGRSLRKLQFRGVRYTPPTPENWHALIGPADVASNQMLWFVHRSEDAETGTLVGLILNGVTGIVQFFVSEGASKAHLPATKAIGELVSVDADAGPPVVLLEVPFDYGRWLVLRALDIHWRGEAAQAIPDEYALYNDLLWQFADPVVDESLPPYYDTPAADELTADELERVTAELLSHPAMVSWIAQNRGLLGITQGGAGKSGAQKIKPEMQAVMVELVLKQLDQWEEREQFLSAVEASLRAQAAWLHLAGDEANAHNAHLLATHMHTIPLARNPLAAALVAAGFQARA